MSDLIIPGSTGRRGALTLYLPASAMEEPTMVCRVPTGLETTCGALFYPGQENLFQHHCGDCAKANAEWVQTASIRKRLPFMDDDWWDPEVAEHMRRLGQRMRDENRLEVKPHERAGFS